MSGLECPFEICRCKEFQKITEEFLVFSPGVFHKLKKKLPVPEGADFIWVKNRINPSSPNFNKPHLVEGESQKRTGILATKWIPFLPGFVSQRLVNEIRNPNNLLR